jgi:hypothetical protein
MVKRILVSISVLALLVLSASCRQLDVIGNASVKSFDAVLNVIPDSVKADEMNVGWSLSAPDGSARFIWSKDYSKSPVHDVMIELDAQPFIDAGLDVNKLPDGMFFDSKIMVGADLGDEQLTYPGEATPLASYEKIVGLKRETIKYHAALGHFGVDLQNGNVFEWAKDMSKTDKDIVFALDPKVFIDAGADPAAIKGWTLAKVPVMDAKGRKAEVEKLLKPFNLQ